VGYLAALARRSDYRKNRAAGGVTVLASPGSSLSLLAPTHGALRRASTPRRWTRLGARTALGRAG